MNMNCLHRACYNFIFEGERHSHKHKVEPEHGEAEQLGHLPAGDEDAQEDGEEH